MAKTADKKVTFVSEDPDPLQFGSTDAIYVVNQQTENKGTAAKEKGDVEKNLPAMTNTVCCEAHVLRRWLIDIGICVPVGTVALLTFLGVISPKLPGYYCKDPGLSFQFRGDTISTALLIVVSILCPFLWLTGVEYFHQNNGRPSMKHMLMRSALRGWRWYREYLVGALFTFSLVDILKTVIPEPRPHYFDSCMPNITSGISCSAGSYVYDFEYVCAGKGRYGWMHDFDVRKSFPSGHAALSTFVCVFMCCYFHKRVVTKRTNFLRVFLQFLFMCWAVVCSFTRITDHRHHWWDVLFGVIFGAAGATYTVRYLCNSFRRLTIMEDKPLENGGSGGPSTNHNNHHTSLKRLISSNSSYSNATLSESKELSEVL